MMGVKGHLVEYLFLLCFICVTFDHILCQVIFFLHYFDVLYSFDEISYLA